MEAFFKAVIRGHSEGVLENLITFDEIGKQM
jgi:hypothetical protein